MTYTTGEGLQPAGSKSPESASMPIEIERKFLVKGAIVLPRDKQKILQGYLPDDTHLAIEAGHLLITPIAKGPTVRLPLTAQIETDIKSYVLNPAGQRVLRIRMVEGRQAIFCMKVSLRSTMSRIEIELPVPELDAYFFVQASRSKTLRKTRYHVEYDGKTWDVDFFSDPFNGLVTAEIELLSESEPFTSPPWLGAEVTDLPEFSNRALAEAQRIPGIRSGR